MEHPVPSGPLAVRWLRTSVGRGSRGNARDGPVELENAGLAAWRERVKASYHWLDERGNPILWDGLRTPIELAPGARTELELRLRGPIPPGPYRLAFDLVDEGRLWFAEVGNHAPELEIEVLPRSAEGAVDWLPADAEPAPDRAERIRAAHEEGYAAVGGSFESADLQSSSPTRPAAAAIRPSPTRSSAPRSSPASSRTTRSPACPPGAPEGDEPWLYDGRITARLRAGRRGG